MTLNNKTTETKTATKITIIPTVLASNREEFDERLSRLLLCSKDLQIDFMDEHFVPNKGVDLEDIPDLKRWKEWSFEAHVMAYHPEQWVEEVAKKGFKKMIFHYEAIEDKKIESLANEIREHNMIPILAINPETPVSRIFKHTKFVDGILFLGVHPGFNGAPYVKDTPKRILELYKYKTKNDNWFIQVDGGMTPETIHSVTKAGATRINSGSFVGNAPDPKIAVAKLYEALNKANNINTSKTDTTKNTLKKIIKKSTTKQITKPIKKNKN